MFGRESKKGCSALVAMLAPFAAFEPSKREYRIVGIGGDRDERWYSASMPNPV